MSADHITLPRAVVEQVLAALEAMVGWQSLAPITEQENAKTQAADLRAALAAPQAEAAKTYDAGDIIVLAAAAKTGNPEVIKLAAQLTDQQPCPFCDYVKHNCRCSPAPDLRPNTPEGAPTLATAAVDQQLEHLVKSAINSLHRANECSISRVEMLRLIDEAITDLNRGLTIHVALMLKGGAA